MSVLRPEYAALHRCVPVSQHDPQLGFLHGCCIICGDPWPCCYAPTTDNYPSQEKVPVADLLPDGLGRSMRAVELIARFANIVHGYATDGLKWSPEDGRTYEATVVEIYAALTGKKPEPGMLEAITEQLP